MRRVGDVRLVHERRVRGHRHRLLGRRELQRDVRPVVFSAVTTLLSGLVALEVRELRRHRVAAGLQHREREVPDASVVAVRRIPRRAVSSTVTPGNAPPGLPRSAPTTCPRATRRPAAAQPPQGRGRAKPPIARIDFVSPYAPLSGRDPLRSLHQLRESNTTATTRDASVVTNGYRRGRMVEPGDRPESSRRRDSDSWRPNQNYDLAATGPVPRPEPARALNRESAGRSLATIGAAPSSPGRTSSRPGLDDPRPRDVRGSVRFDDGSRAPLRHGRVELPPGPDRRRRARVRRRRRGGARGVPPIRRARPDARRGTSLAGQCCNAAVVLDFSRHLRRVLEVDPARGGSHGSSRARCSTICGGKPNGTV